jgi:hypothetical protein
VLFLCLTFKTYDCCTGSVSSSSSNSSNIGCPVQASKLADCILNPLLDFLGLAHIHVCAQDSCFELLACPYVTYSFTISTGAEAPMILPCKDVDRIDQSYTWKWIHRVPTFKYYSNIISTIEAEVYMKNKMDLNQDVINNSNELLGFMMG